MVAFFRGFGYNEAKADKVVDSNHDDDRNTHNNNNNNNNINSSHCMYIICYTYKAGKV